LLAIDESEKHVLSVWAWQEEQLVVKSSVRLEIYLLFAVTSYSMLSQNYTLLYVAYIRMLSLW